MSTEPVEPAAAQTQRFPDFFIVGHQKSGTTALYEMLRRHPQIFMPDLKEPRFFASDLRFRFDPGASSGLPRTLDEYLALFEEAAHDQRVGEASPSYLTSQTAASAIAAVQPAARCIAILREPASFVRSLHLQLLQEHVEAESDLRTAVQNEELVRDGRRVLRYSDHVHYVEQLRRFHAVFPPEQILVLIYDDFRRENDATVRRVLRFLDVDQTVRIETVEANPSVGARSLRRDGLVRALHGRGGPLSRAAYRGVRLLTPAGLREGALRTLRRRIVYDKPAPVDVSLVNDLRRRYASEVTALSDYLSRDLVSLWGYDELG